MPTTISCSIPPFESFDAAVDHARLAEELGYDAIMLSHIAARDSFTLAGALAQHTQRIGLATAVAPLYHRSPASMAQSAATVDDVSGGRFRLGLGVGHRVTMAGWHGQEIGNPASEMREYIGVVRAILAGETRHPASAGRRRSPSWAWRRARTSRSTRPRCLRPCCGWPGRYPTVCCYGRSHRRSCATW